MRRRARRGFTLLEVLVASTIMAVAVGTLLSALTTSLGNASRLTEHDRAAVLAQRVMDELLTDQSLPLGQEIARNWTPAESAVPGGWHAHLEPFETLPNLPPDKKSIERVVLEVWWMSGRQRKSLALEAFRIAPQRRLQ
ncbi:MAG: type II secretion system protein [Bryobacteraceae bacterium]